MKKVRFLALGLIMVAVICGGTYQAVPGASPSISAFMPEGALLYIEAKDFGAILRDWNSSAEKQEWLKSDTLSVFSNSRLFLRLKEAQGQFAAAAGLKPNMIFLEEAAGKESGFAWYDIGKLQFLYVSRVPSARAMQSALWQMRGKFESRKAGGVDFFVRTDPASERVVAFAVVGDYLVLATREDLVASAVSLIAGQKLRTVRNEDWFAKSTAKAAEPGDFRMVLNLRKLVPSPYFRTYWIQQNITDTKQYYAAIADLYRTAHQYREERILLREAGEQVVADSDPAKSVPELLRLIPDNIGYYRAVASPSADTALSTLQAKILAPRPGNLPGGRVAPQVTSGLNAGTESDLETRIDVGPTRSESPAVAIATFKKLLEDADLKSLLVMHSTQQADNAVFVGVRSGVVLRAARDWNGETVRAALQAILKQQLTASDLGTTWVPAKAGNGTIYELDGLLPLAVATHGNVLVVANDPQMVDSVLQRMNRPVEGDAVSYVAAFDHGLERRNFARLASLVDRLPANQGKAPNRAREPEFFSENTAGFSRVLAVKSEKIVQHEEADTVRQTVTYEWAQ